MRAWLERIDTTGVRGWAVDDRDYTRRITVTVERNGEVLFEQVADQFRKDLLGNALGDGCYGFRFPGGDVLLALIEDAGSVSIQARTGSGEDVGLHWLRDFAAHRTNGIAIPSAAPGEPAIFGDCFLVSNLREYSPALLMPPTRIPPRLDLRGYHAMRMYVFGDSMWWEGGVTNRTPTAKYFFAAIGGRTQALVQDGRLKLLFDMSNEGPPALAYGDWLKLLHDELRSHGLSPAQCVLMNQNRAFNDSYLEWARRSGEIETMEVLVYDYFVSRLASTLNVAALPDPASFVSQDGSAGRRFVCLNFTPRVERLAFLAWLAGTGLIEEGHVSFGGFANFKMDGGAFAIPSWFPDGEAARDGLERLRGIGPLTVDLPVDPKQPAPYFELGPLEAYRDAVFSIVTESDYSDGEIVRITEKSLKPLALGHPVIVVGNPHSLRLLRDAFGFRTFAPFIDEAYDAVEDPAERMTMIQAEVRRLCEMPMEKLLDLRRELADVLEHNRWQARRGLAARYREQIEPELLRELARLAPTA